MQTNWKKKFIHVLPSKLIYYAKIICVQIFLFFPSQKNKSLFHLFLFYSEFLVLNFWHNTSALSFAETSHHVHKNYISTLVLSPEHEAQNPMFRYFPKSWYSREILSNYDFFFPKMPIVSFLRNYLVKRGCSCMEGKNIKYLELLS